MAGTLQMLGMTCLLISLFCYGFVVYKMYTEGDTIIFFVCLGSFFLACGLGAIVAYVYGWIKANDWELKPVMFTWTAIWAVSFLLNVLAIFVG